MLRPDQALPHQCQYCIPAHKIQAIEAGATEEEIKIAIEIAANVARGSTLFYGNEYDPNDLKKEIKTENFYKNLNSETKINN